MNHESIKGLVIRETRTGENDVFLSVLTAEKGRIGILAKGARSIKGGNLAVAQVFSYATFDYYTRGNVNILKAGIESRSFFDLSKREEGASLAFYLCDLASELSDENVEAGELLRLLLNSLHAIEGRLYPDALIKAAFELRAMAVTGYAPVLEACDACGCAEAELFYFYIDGGTMRCAECISRTQTVRCEEDARRGASPTFPVTPAVLAAMRYCVAGPLSRLFSFTLEDPTDLEMLGRIAESYVLSHLERGFPTLNYYYEAKRFAEEMAELLESVKKTTPTEEPTADGKGGE